MENPMTHNEPTKIIGKTLLDAEEDIRNHVCGLSRARHIHDALEQAGWLRSPEEHDKYISKKNE